MTERQKVSLATLASICLHLLVLGLILIWTAFLPKTDRPRPEDSKRLEVTLVPPKPTPTPAATPEATPTPTPPPVAQATPSPSPGLAEAPTPAPTPKSKLIFKSTLNRFLDLTGLNATEKAPDHALIESSINSQAASELPARGNAPLPTQDGLNRRTLEFASTDLLLGQVRSDSSEILLKKEEPSPEASEPETKLITQETMADLPQPMPVATPPPALNGFALGRPTPVPAKVTPTPVPRTSVAIAPPPPKTMPAPRLKMPPPGYQQHRDLSKIDGGITNRGKSGVAAIGNPVGRYQKVVTDEIGSRWYSYVNGESNHLPDPSRKIADPSLGEVKIKFYVNSQGKIEGLRVISNTANDVSARMAIQAATEAKIPPMPSEVSDVSGGRMEISYNFTLFPNE